MRLAIIVTLPTDEMRYTREAILSVFPHGNPPSAIARYQMYLKSYYANSTIMLDDKLFIAPCSEFIDLSLVTGRQRDPLDIDSILTPDSRSVLVEGPAGIGKSTLCWQLCRKWDALKSLREYKIVILLQLREKRIQKISSLQEVFYHEDKRLCKGVVDEVRRCEGEGILLIMDGFDEIPLSAARDKESLIIKLCNGKCLPKTTRLITGRPSARYIWNLFPCRPREIEILGFTDEAKMQFTKNAAKHEPGVFCNFKSFFLSNPAINSLMSVPVNCAIIAQLYKDIGRSRELVITTMTGLYTTLVLVLIRRHMIECGKWDVYSRVPDSFSDLPQEVVTALKRVSELAYRGLQQGLVVSLSFTDSDIRDHLGLLTETKEMYVCGGGRASYSFLHLSIQEFLAAWHIARFPINLKGTISQIFEEAVESDLKIFLSGLIGCSQMNLRNYLSKFTLNCLYEAQDPEIFKKMSICHMQSLFLESSYDMYVLGYVLANASISWDLTVTASLDTLAISLADHSPSDGKILGSIYKLNLYSKPNSIESSRLKGLPNCLLQSIHGLVVSVTNPLIPVLVQDLTLLFGLKYIYFDFSILCSHDYVLCRKLREVSSLESLEFHSYNISAKGMQALTKTLPGCLKLERFTMKNYFSFSNSVLEERNYLKLVKKLLSHSSLKRLNIDTVPFQPFVLELPRNVERISFRLRLWKRGTMMSRLSNCLFCIANMCKSPIVKSLAISLDLPSRVVANFPPRVYCDFLAILNNSLRCNASVKVLDLGRRLCIPNPIHHSILSRALRRDPEVPLLDLRRSKSLCDLTTVRYGTMNITKNPSKKTNKKSKRNQSCPDLLDMQSLHSVHPDINHIFEHQCFFHEPAKPLLKSINHHYFIF